MLSFLLHFPALNKHGMYVAQLKNQNYNLVILFYLKRKQLC